MSKFLIFDLGNKGENEQLFNDLNDKINSLEGYPNKEGTTKYSEPIYHPDGILVAIEIMDGLEKHLDVEQFGKIIEKLDESWKTID